MAQPPALPGAPLSQSESEHAQRFPAPVTRSDAVARMMAAEDALRAIGAGEVDAFVVSDGGAGRRVFSLSTADRPYRIVVENMRDGAATLSAGDLIMYANHRLALLLSCPRETIVGSRLTRFLAGGVPIAPKQLRGPDGLGATLELELLDDNGVLVPVLVGASPLDVDGDQLTCLTFTDLRAQKAQEREIARLEQAQAMQIADVREEFVLDLAESQKLEALGVLAGGIAHDFNNLLALILGNTSLALSTLGPGARERAPLHQVELAATRSADLAQQMLAYSGQGKFVVEILNLAEIVSGQTELITAAISTMAVVTLDLAPDTPTRRGRRDPVAPGGPESDHQRLGGDRRGGRDDHRSLRLARRRPGPSVRLRRRRATQGGQIRLPRGRRYRRGNGRRNEGKDLRPVLHHEVHGARSRPRRRPGHRARPRRRDEGP